MTLSFAAQKASLRSLAGALLVFSKTVNNLHLKEGLKIPQDSNDSHSMDFYSTVPSVQPSIYELSPLLRAA